MYAERRLLDDLREAFSFRLPLADRLEYIAFLFQNDVNALSVALPMLDAHVPETNSSATVYDFV